MDDIRPPASRKAARFIDQFPLTIRRCGLDYAAKKTYVHWVIRFIHFHRKRHAKKTGPFEVEQFLGDLGEGGIVPLRRSARDVAPVMIFAIFYTTLT